MDLIDMGYYRMPCNRANACWIKISGVVVYLWNPENRKT